MNSNLVTLIPQFFDSSGNPLNGGTLETYVAGTVSTLATYPTNADALAGTNANSTSISINASGYPSSGGTVIGVFLKPGKQYKFILKDSTGTTIYSLDNISNLTDTLLDGNGNEVIKLVGVASAVNEITVTNAITGTKPIIAATGDDTNVGLKIKTKGIGTLDLLDGSDNELFKTSTVANAVNEVTLANAATGNSPSLSATGDDTNIGLNIKAKGTGAITVGQASGTVTVGGDSSTPLTLTSSQVKLSADQPFVDSSGNEYVKVSKTASAVNEFTVTNAATGVAPVLSATGDDANIDLALQAKGTGAYAAKGAATSSAELRLYEQTTNGTNYIGLKAPASVTADKTFTLPSADGTANQVLQTNGSGVLSFAPPGAMTLIATATASNSATIDFTSISNSTYNSYLIVGDNIVPTTDSVFLQLRMSQGGTFNSTASAYVNECLRYSSTTSTVSGDASGGGATGITVNAAGETLGNNSNEQLFFVMHLSNMGSSSTFKRVSIQGEYLSAAPAYLHYLAGGQLVANSNAVDGFRFLMSSGTIASGVFKLYGINN
jgi:hypothetical protein